MKEQILSIVIDPTFWGIIASTILVGLGTFIHKIGKEKYEIIYACLLKGFMHAEKAIPDNTENKSLAKFDIALKVVNEELAENNIKLSDKILSLAKRLFTLWAGKQKGII